MLLAFLGVLRHIPLILPFGFNGASVKEMQGKPERCGDVYAGNLVTEYLFVKLGKSQGIGADCFDRFFLDTGAVALGGGGASPNGVVSALASPNPTMRLDTADFSAFIEPEMVASASLAVVPAMSMLSCMT